MSKVRVLHILCTNSFSGAENVAISLINNFKDEIESVYVSPDGPIREVLKENNIAFYPIKKMGLFELKKAIKKTKPDIVHAHDFMAGFYSACAAGNTPVINHLHNNAPWIKKFSHLTLMYLAASKKIKKILTVSNSVMDEYIFGKLCKKKTTVIGNQIDVSAIRDKSTKTDASEPYDVIFLGRLSTPKNPVGFVEIVDKLRLSFPEIRTVMIGDGELRNQVEAKISELKLQENIALMGFCKNPYAFLKSAKILCMPSLWDGCPLASVEALSLGKPIVASPVGGLVNIVNDDCGKLCANTDEFVEQISLLLTDTDTYNKKSANALVRADSFDNIAEFKNTIKQIYAEISTK